jgi:hypothetical protein
VGYGTYTSFHCHHKSIINNCEGLNSNFLFDPTKELPLIMLNAGAPQTINQYGRVCKKEKLFIIALRQKESIICIFYFS